MQIEYVYSLLLLLLLLLEKERRGATSTPRRGVGVRVLCCQSCCRFLTRKATRPREWYSKGFLFHRKRNPKLDDEP